MYRKRLIERSPILRSNELEAKILKMGVAVRYATVSAVRISRSLDESVAMVNGF